MSNYPHPIIAREGWPHVAVSVAVAVVVTAFAGRGWAIACWIVVLFILQFFRDPPRVVRGAAKAVLSPADGTVVTVERAEDVYLQRPALKISVFMNVFNAHSNRSPADGEVRGVWYHAGKFFNASLTKSSHENERNAIWIRTPAEHDVTCVQIAGLIARRIFCYVKPGDALVRGQRYGFIRFGSRLDVYMPPSAVPKVSVGDKVYAASSVLAEIG